MGTQAGSGDVREMERRVYKWCKSIVISSITPRYAQGVPRSVLGGSMVDALRYK